VARTDTLIPIRHLAATMRVRDWKDILADVTERDADPHGWRAVAGRRRDGLGEDLYIGHPVAGLYQLKTYAKNPFEVRGVGTRVARRVDGDIEPLLPNRDGAGRFAVRRPPEDEDHAERMVKRLQAALEVHADAPTTPDDFFDDVMEALDSPAFGPLEYDGGERPSRLDNLSSTFEDAEELLNAELDDLIEEDEVGRGFQ
jgi:hypothetical protein